jgi:hypothetical protein
MNGGVRFPSQLLIYPFHFSQTILMEPKRELPIGCIFDGAHGDEYNGLRVQKLAQQYGWTGQAEDENSLGFQEAIDEATEYLEQFAPAGHYVGWENGGDFGVWEAESSNDNDNGNDDGDYYRAGIDYDPRC